MRLVLLSGSSSCCHSVTGYVRTVEEEVDVLEDKVVDGEVVAVEVAVLL
jgi:hypothetical protein